MADFSTLIQEWYRLNKRDLPWRQSDSAYKVWISEIILQQTQVVQGLDYYVKFVSNFPTIFDLANAEEDEVLKLWQGLGYYSRARNLHFAAKQVVNEFNGVFPVSYNDLMKLKGVGEYTASAVSSIISNLPHAVVDGNVFRVLSRCFLVNTAINSTKGKKEFTILANSLLDVNNAGDHNQAIMEIGALVCKPKNPKCDSCPINSKCLSYVDGTMLNYPVKDKKVKVRNRYLNYLVTIDKKNIVIKKRGPKDIWQGLFDFPLIETDAPAEDMGKGIYLDKQIKHILSHQHIYASFWIKEVEKLTAEGAEQIVEIKDLEDFALPQLLVKYLNQSDYFNR
jgi:A/G-specific adenine glycosylase